MHIPQVFSLRQRQQSSRLLSVLLLLSMLTGLWATAPVQTAQAVSANLVISQIYGGGGNAGASYTHDFVELFNRGSGAVSVNGLSIQYASSLSERPTGVDV